MVYFMEYHWAEKLRLYWVLHLEIQMDPIKDLNMKTLMLVLMVKEGFGDLVYLIIPYGISIYGNIENSL